MNIKEEKNLLKFYLIVVIATFLILTLWLVEHFGTALDYLICLALFCLLFLILSAVLLLKRLLKFKEKY